MAVPTERPATPVRAPRPPPSTVVLVLTGPIDRAHIEPLCDRIRSLLLRSEADLVACDLGGLPDPDAATVEALCRLQLTARRLGRRVEVLDASLELRGLFEMTGLSGVAPPCAELGLEPSGQAEQGKPARRVEEEGDPADPIA